jgi:hypothetical protein
MDTERIKKRLAYWETTYDNLTSCYQELIKSGVQSYEIDDRALTRFNIPNIRKAIEEAEQNIDKYEAMLNGQKPRKIMAIVPRDW